MGLPSPPHELWRSRWAAATACAAATPWRDLFFASDDSCDSASRTSNRTECLRSLRTASLRARTRATPGPARHTRAPGAGAPAPTAKSTAAAPRAPGTRRRRSPRRAATRPKRRGEGGPAGGSPRSPARRPWPKRRPSALAGRRGRRRRVPAPRPRAPRARARAPAPEPRNEDRVDPRTAKSAVDGLKMG